MLWFPTYVMDLPVVMVVDDEYLMLQVLGRVLQADNYELVLVKTVKEAKERALQLGERLRVLITDQNLNGKGTDLLVALRAQAPRLQCIILTGDSLKVREVPEGVTLVDKPFNSQPLRDLVQEKLILG